MTFGQTLKQLLNISGVKSTSLALKLGYDTSYISRWISDSKQPSLKNNSRLFPQIAEIILEESDDEAIKRLREAYYPGGSKKELAKAIENALSQSFARLHSPSRFQDENLNAVYLSDGVYKEGFGIYTNAIFQYMQENDSVEIPCISSVPLQNHTSRDEAFWSAFLTDPQISSAHITMHQLIDSSDFSAHIDDYCAAICTFSSYHERVQYEFYEYVSVADIRSIQFTFIAGQLLYQKMTDPLTGGQRSLICSDTASLSDQWFSICTRLQLLPKILSHLIVSSNSFVRYLYDYVMGGKLLYLLNIMHPIYMEDELSKTLIEQYLPDMETENRVFYMDYNRLCSKAEKEIILYRSALLEYFYSGTLLFCGRLIRIQREHRILHLKQLLRDMEQGRCKLAILNDLNPLLSYSDMPLSLYLSKNSGFMASSDSSVHHIIQIRSQSAVGCFHQFFSHLKELGGSFVINDEEAYDFIKKGILLV